MSEKKLVILTAVRMEARAVARALGIRTGSVWRNGCVTGDSGFQISTRMVGIGAKRLPLRWNAGCVVLAGFAGALDPSLRVGDVVLDWPAEAVKSSAPEGPFQLGKIHCASEIAATPEQKSTLFTWTGALAVEMEGEAVRRRLAGTGIPLIGLRAITDAADDALDPALLALVDRFGQPRPLALAGFLARRPGRIASLRRLGAAARLAGQRLGEAIAALVRSDELRQLLQSR